MHRATVPTLLKHICFFIDYYKFYLSAATADEVSRACLIEIRSYGEGHPVGRVGRYLLHLLLKIRVSGNGSLRGSS